MNIEEIKKELPNFPLEVIETWLMTFVGRFGWPPEKDNEWRFVLRGHKNLTELRSLKWEKRVMEISPKIFTPKDLAMLIDLLRSHVLGHSTLFSVTMSDGLERFNRIKDYLKQNGVFPAPIVLAETNAGYEILDGSHRITAMLYLYGYFNIQSDEAPCLTVKLEQPVWIAQNEETATLAVAH